MLRHAPVPVVPSSEAFFDRLFSAQAVERGVVVRRSVRSVENEVGHRSLIAAVVARGFHPVECGQFTVTCDTGQVQLIC